MRTCIIFGTGSTAKRILHEVGGEYNIIGFLDNDKSKWGSYIDGIPILGDSQVCNNIDFDEVFVCSLPAMHMIREQLMDEGVPAFKINTERISTQVNARINFIRDFASVSKSLIGNYSIAEGGVYQGEFSKEINACFPDSKLYLFDTFEGFDSRDVEVEHKENYSVSDVNHIGNTSVELVLSKLPHKDRAIIKKGYFPETTHGLEDETFFFVNLDFDLYNPTLEGLRFFYPRIAEKGIILVHDYFNPGYKGISKAINDYSDEMGITLKMLPIGDHCSIGIIK